MTLDEAIRHAEEVAKEKRKDLARAEAYNLPSEGCEACAEEHEQLAEWLKDYKRLLDERPQGEWITKEHSIEYYCSNCGERLDQCCENFCCHCGAKMGGAT